MRNAFTHLAKSHGFEINWDHLAFGDFNIYMWGYVVNQKLGEAWDLKMYEIIKETPFIISALNHRYEKVRLGIKLEVLFCIN